MADDLGEEWWKETPDSDASDADIADGTKKGIKRTASTSSCDGEDVPEAGKSGARPPNKRSKREKTNKVKQKKKRKQSRRKITEEDEDSLHKGGAPVDVLGVMSQTQSVTEGDSSDGDDDDDDDSATLDPGTDFFPANRSLEANKYLSQVFPKWQVLMKKYDMSPGSPLLLILTSSAIRAVQLKREIKGFLGKDCKTAKLFAKHMKLEDQKKYLQKNVCHVGIGTPNRVQALVQAGSLKLDSMQGLVLDWNWRDVKLKRMVDVPDVKRDLTQLLRDFVVENVKNSHCKIAIL